MFTTIKELQKYVETNYLEVTDFRIDDSHYNIYCEQCKVVRGFQVTEQHATQVIKGGLYGRYIVPDLQYPQTVVFRCPVCTAFKMWLVFEVKYEKKSKGGIENFSKYFRITSIPGEGIEDIEELPEKPNALREAYRQAIRSMDANAYLAAAAMFRRALQVITRDILSAKPGNLAIELKEIVGVEYNGVKIIKSFQDVGYIIKEAGNQGAHPDRDPDLLEFTIQDAKDLRDIFMELVSDLFIVPKAIQKSKEDFLKRRKLNIK